MARSNRQKTYVAIINAVKTPISFLVLIVLVVEGLFLSLATSHDTATHVVGIIGGVGVLILAAAIVSAFEWLRPGTLFGSGRGARPEDANLPTTVPTDKFHVLCVAGSHTDGPQRYSTADIIKHYGFDVTHLTSATFDTLITSLLNTKYDLVHFDVAVARNRLILSDEEMLPQLLSNLLEHSETKVVILSDCESFVLGSSLPSGIVIAASGVHGNVYSAWTDWFYRLLSEGLPVSRAIATTRAITDPFGEGGRTRSCASRTYRLSRRGVAGRRRRFL